METEKNEIVVYQPDETIRLDVRVENHMVWLNRQQLAQLFGRDVKTIGKHIANALKEELAPVVAKNAPTEKDGTNRVVAKFATTAADGKVYQVEYYNLEMVLSVGFRVKSPQGVLFRRWANQVLNRYVTTGIAIRNPDVQSLALEIDRRLSVHDREIGELREKIDYIVQASIPAPEQVFCGGRFLDAQAELTRIVKTAKRRIVLVDNYIDERTLMMLGSRRAGVACAVYTMKPNSPKLAPALANYARQYPALPIKLNGYKKSHDRFLIIDDTVWHIGASLKDAGSALFALMKMELDPSVILSLLP